MGNAHSKLNEIVYGQDDRLDPVDLNLSKIQKRIIRNTFAQIPMTSIVVEEGKIRVKAPTLKVERKLCDGERFEDEIAGATCSGFLISPQIVLTAGHCMRSNFKCVNFVWVTGYQKQLSGSNDIELKAENIYRCQEIITQKVNKATGVDYSLVLLEREVPNFSLAPLKFREASSRISDDESVSVAGFPSGIPLKIASGASVINNDNEGFFSTNLDTFTGNSGSIVYSEDTGFLEGILVRGNTDYVNKDVYRDVVNDDGSISQVKETCKIVNRVDSFPEGEDFEEVTRISEVEELYYTEDDLIFLSLIKSKNYVKAFEMLSLEINVNVRDLENGKTILHYLIEDEAPDDVLISFLELRPNLEIRKYGGDSILFIALESESDRLLSLILNSPIDLNKPDSSGKAIIHKLVEMSSIKKLEKVIRVGLSLEVTTQEGDTPLLIALKMDNPVVARFLIENGANMNARNNANKNPIRFAIDAFNIEMLNYFIEKGARPERGLISWLSSTNDMRYLKKIIKRAKDFDSIQLETLREMKRILDDVESL